MSSGHSDPDPSSVQYQQKHVHTFSNWSHFAIWIFTRPSLYYTKVVLFNHLDVDFLIRKTCFCLNSTDYASSLCRMICWIFSYFSCKISTIVVNKFWDLWNLITLPMTNTILFNGYWNSKFILILVVQTEKVPKSSMERLFGQFSFPFLSIQKQWK